MAAIQQAERLSLALYGGSTSLGRFQRTFQVERVLVASRSTQNVHSTPAQNSLARFDDQRALMSLSVVLDLLSVVLDVPSSFVE